jgi:hypothetical protein
MQRPGVRAGHEASNIAKQLGCGVPVVQRVVAEI